MATTNQPEWNKDFVELDTPAAVYEKSTANPKKLIVILFNVESPFRGSLEHRLKLWRHKYETRNDVEVEFYKCVLRKGEQELKTKFDIQVGPAFIFICGGEIIFRLKDLDETNPDHKETTKYGDESKDEKRVKQQLDGLCKTLLLEQQKPL